MFVLLKIQDTVPVAPKAFKVPAATAILDALNKKYANKLVPEQGLALSAYDVLTAEDGKVTWGNGLMYYKVTFRLLTFAPFVGEVICGEIVTSTKAYVRVSLGFFQDIYIVPELLPPNSAYDSQQDRWFWWSDDEETSYTQEQLVNTVVANRLYLDPGEPIRFRVESVKWQDVRPPLPTIDLKAAAKGETPYNESARAPDVDPFDQAGFKIMATIADSGLGIVSWWAQQDGGEEIEMEQED